MNRIENRTISKTISIRQSGFGEDAWIPLEPLSTSTFAWEDPYGQKLLDAKIDGHGSAGVWRLDLERTGLYSAVEVELGLQFHVLEIGDIKVARFTEDRASSSHEIRSLTPGNWGNSQMQRETQSTSTPMELIIELGVVGVSVVDHRPKELSYLYMERVFVSYLTGYDGGTTSRSEHLPMVIGPYFLNSFTFVPCRV